MSEVIRMSEQDLVWLAGWLEGEGCFSNNTGSPSVAAVSTDLDIIQRVHSLLGAKTIGTLNLYDNKHKKRCYRSVVYGYKAYTLMKQLFPLLGLRRQAILTIIFEQLQSHKFYTVEEGIK